MNQPEDRSTSDSPSEPSESESKSNDQRPFKPLPSLRTRGLHDRTSGGAAGSDSAGGIDSQDSSVSNSESNPSELASERPTGCPFKPGSYRPSPAAEAREKQRQGLLRKQRIERAQAQAELGPTGYLTGGCVLASWWMLPFAWLALLAFAWGTQMISIVGILVAASGFSSHQKRWAMAALVGHAGAIAVSIYWL